MFFLARRGSLVALFLTAELTIGIALGLFGFVKALFDKTLRIVFLNPRQDVFGVEADLIAKVRMPFGRGGDGVADHLHAALEQKLQRRVG